MASRKRAAEDDGVLSEINGVSSKRRKDNKGQSLVSVVDGDENGAAKDVFSTMMRDVGVVIGTPVVLTGELVAARKSLQKRLAFDPNATRAFLDGLHRVISDASGLKMCLLPSIRTSQPSGGLGASQSSQFSQPSRRRGQVTQHDSLMRLLLGVAALQVDLYDVLLEKIPEYLAADDDHTVAGQAENIPRLILSQFRWLDSVVDGKRLTNKLLEVMEVCPPALQKDAIAFIPEIIDDQDHPVVVKTLQGLMEEKEFLTVPILDTLSNLHLDVDDMQLIREAVMGKLASARAEDLPVVIRFLLQTITPENANEVVHAMRKNLEFLALEVDVDVARSQRVRKAVAGRQKMGETLTLEALRSGIRFQKAITNAFMREIKRVEAPSQHKVLDVWVLFVVHTIAGKAKDVEALLRKKVAAGLFTTDLLRAAMATHSEALAEYVGTILALAAGLVRTSDATVRRFGCQMYCLLFQAFPDAYTRQEVISCIVGHIGSSIRTEIDAALNVLLDLVAWNVGAVRAFTVFVKGVLDYLDGQSNDHIRKLFRIFTALAYTTDEEGQVQLDDALQDEITIVIRKQLSNPSLRYKRIGIIGGVATVARLGTPAKGASNSLDVDEASLTEDHFKGPHRDCVEMLKMLTQNCAKTAFGSAFLCDELSAVVRERVLHCSIIVMINRMLAERQFEDRWVVDHDSSMLPPLQRGLQGAFWFNLDASGEIALKLLQPLLASAPGSADSVVSLCSEFRLTYSCERALSNDSMAEVDALISCPIVMFEKEAMENFSDLSKASLDTVCLALFHCINWMRELLNGYSTQTDAETRVKTLKRLGQIIELEEMFEHCVGHCPAFEAPSVEILLECEEDKGAVAGRPKGKLASGKRPEKKADDSDGDGEEKSAKKRGRSGRTKKKEGRLIDRIVFRELELETAGMLNYPNFGSVVFDTDEEPHAGAEFSMQPALLRYLLQDVNSKLEHILAPPKRPGPFGGGAAAKIGGFQLISRLGPADLLRELLKRDILSAMCSHLEKLSAHLDASSKEGGEPDATLVTCVELILECFEKVFRSPELRCDENQRLLRETCNVFASRASSGEQAAPPPLAQVRDGALSYFKKFAEGVVAFSTTKPLVNVLLALYDLGPGSEEWRSEISVVAGSFLQHRWTDPVRPDLLVPLVKTFIGLALSPVAKIEILANEHLPKLLFSRKEDRERFDEGVRELEKDWPTLSATTVLHYYKVLLAEVATLMGTLSSQTATASDDERVARLLAVSQCVTLFGSLTPVVKVYHTRPFVQHLMRQGCRFVMAFNRGLGFLKERFVTHSGDVQAALKNLQHSTRLLHSLCAEGKCSKDMALARSVPPLKRALETLLFKVKELLSANKCLDAFFIGNLKHRDLQGNEVSSQLYKSEDERSLDEEDEEENDNSEEKEEEEDEDETSRPRKKAKLKHSDEEAEQEEEERKQRTRKEKSRKRKHKKHKKRKEKRKKDDSHEEAEESGEPVGSEEEREEDDDE